MATTMRSLTSVFVSLLFPLLLPLSVTVTRPVTSALTFLFFFEILFPISQTAHVLVKCRTASILRENCLKFGSLLEASLDLFVSVTKSDRGIHTLQV